MKTLKVIVFVAMMALGPAALEAGQWSTINATHDNGQGKSKDGGHDDLGDIAVAPEPETYWLFLMGCLVIVAYMRASGRTLVDNQ
jgi:hypothetical protein